MYSMFSFYLRSYKSVYNVWSFLVEGLQDHGWVDGERKVEMYHASTDDDSKKRILGEFSKPDGRVRVVVSTIAFGMGIAIPNIRMVIHWGAPKSFLAYWQEIGRAGRDGKPALAVAILYPRSLCPRVCDNNLKEMFVSEECIRRGVLLNLLTKDMDANKVPKASKCENKKCIKCICACCLCCSNCFSRCTCEGKETQTLFKTN